MKNAKTLLERLGLGSLALAMALGLAACSKKNPTPPDRTDSQTKEETKEEITTGGDGELTPNYSGKTYDYDKFWILMRDQTDYVNEMAVEKLARRRRCEGSPNRAVGASFIEPLFSARDLYHRGSPSGHTAG